MKYFLLIIRHFFPRKYWKQIRITEVYDSDGDMKLPAYRKITLQDQFGNLKTFKV